MIKKWKTRTQGGHVVVRLSTYKDGDSSASIEYGHAHVLLKYDENGIPVECIDTTGQFNLVEDLD